MTRDIDVLETAAKGLAYTKRPGFGSHALLAPNGVMFAAVAGVGLLAVKLPDEALHAALAARGAGPWEYGGRAMERWLLLPRDMLAEPEQLREWVRRAHALALHPPAKAKEAIAAEDAGVPEPEPEPEPAPEAPRKPKAPAKRAPAPEPAPAAAKAAKPPAPAKRPARKAPAKAAKKAAAPAKKAGAKKARRK